MENKMKKILGKEKEKKHIKVMAPRIHEKNINNEITILTLGCDCCLLEVTVIC